MAIRSKEFRASVLRLLISIVPIFLAYACGPAEIEPRDRVLEFFKLVTNDSFPDVLPYIDLAQLAKNSYSKEKYDSLTQKDKEKQLLRAMVTQGEFRATWINSQIVVNSQQYINDSMATVEVSYIDRRTRVQYLTQMGLIKRKGQWVIYTMMVTGE